MPRKFDMLQAATTLDDAVAVLQASSFKIYITCVLSLPLPYQERARARMLIHLSVPYTGQQKACNPHQMIAVLPDDWIHQTHDTRPIIPSFQECARAGIPTHRTCCLHEAKSVSRFLTPQLLSHFSLVHCPYTATMSHIPPETTSGSNYQLIFDDSLEDFRKKTGRDLALDPLLTRFESCDSPLTALAVLQEQIPLFGRTRSSSDKLINGLNRTVNNLYTLSSTICAALSLVCPNKVKVIPRTGANIYVLGIPTSGVDPHQYRRPSLGGLCHITFFYASLT